MVAAREALALGLVALALRGAAAWSLGGGAPFGPDGTGVEAAVHLGGHLYPAHVALVAALGSARAASVATGTLSCLLLWAWGRRVGLGGLGGWLLATLPLGLLPSALSAGDAPALAVVLLGALLSTAGGRAGAVLGGLLAAGAVTVKPLALPALVLLLARPWSLLGAALGLAGLQPWLRPLLHPLPRGGLLGTWWLGSGGAPPAPADLPAWLAAGLGPLPRAPAWALVPLLAAAPLGGLRAHQAPRATRLAALGPPLAALAVAALLGERLQARYLAPALAAALPFLGPLLPRPALAVPAALLPLVPALALLTQLGAERARRDPEAGVPALPVLPWPQVGVAALFEDASTDGATALRRQAADLAATLPPGATVRVQRRDHGREGELAWPLRVARPDLRVEVVPAGTPEAW